MHLGSPPEGTGSQSLLVEKACWWEWLYLWQQECKAAGHIESMVREQTEPILYTAAVLLPPHIIQSRAPASEMVPPTFGVALLSSVNLSANTWTDISSGVSPIWIQVLTNWPWRLTGTPVHHGAIYYITSIWDNYWDSALLSYMKYGVYFTPVSSFTWSHFTDSIVKCVSDGTDPLAET